MVVDVVLDSPRPLRPAAVGLTARLIADGVDWRFAHAIEVARVGPLQPQGLLVMTSEPGVYGPFGIEAFTI